MPKYFSMKMCQSSLFNFDVILKCSCACVSVNACVCVLFFFRAVTINDATLVLIGGSSTSLCSNIPTTSQYQMVNLCGFFFSQKKIHKHEHTYRPQPMHIGEST